MKRCYLSVGIVLTFLLASCATTIPLPTYQDAGFQPEQMDRVFVMPVVDARVDKELQTPFNEIIQEDAMKLLKKKKYDATKVGDASYVVDLTLDEIQDEDPEFIKGVGPDEARWIMAFVLEDLSRKVTFGSSANAEVRLVILDKSLGKVVWRDKVAPKVGQGGLIGMAMVGLMDNDVLHQAVAQLIYKLPKRE